MRADFRFFKLGLASRLLLSGGVFASALALELVLGEKGGAFLLGLPVLILGWFPLMLKKASNKPEEQGLAEEWRPVPMAEVDRLDDGLRESKKLKREVRSVSTGLALGLGIPFLVIFMGVTSVLGRGDLAFVGLNAAFLLAPALLFGKVKVFVPDDISLKMPCFRALLEEKTPEGIVVAPYLRFDKDRAGGDIPEDLRLLYELKRPPADFVGIQVQAAINDGPQGDVPYMYAVVLTKGKQGSSYDLAKRTRAEGYEVEAGGDDSFGTVVIRQTTDNGGYETTGNDCKQLLRTCQKLLAAMGED
jgi:hypothetical protein